MTLLTRKSFADNIKFSNKLQLYRRHNNELLNIRFGVEIIKARDRQTVLINVKEKRQTGSVPK